MGVFSPIKQGVQGRDAGAQEDTNLSEFTRTLADETLNRVGRNLARAHLTGKGSRAHAVHADRFEKAAYERVLGLIDATPGAEALGATTRRASGQDASKEEQQKSRAFIETVARLEPVLKAMPPQERSKVLSSLYAGAGESYRTSRNSRLGIREPLASLLGSKEYASLSETERKIFTAAVLQMPHSMRSQIVDTLDRQDWRARGLLSSANDNLGGGTLGRSLIGAATALGLNEYDARVAVNNIEKKLAPDLRWDPRISIVSAVNTNLAAGDVLINQIERSARRLPVSDGDSIGRIIRNVSPLQSENSSISAREQDSSTRSVGMEPGVKYPIIPQQSGPAAGAWSRRERGGYVLIVEGSDEFSNVSDKAKAFFENTYGATVVVIHPRNKQELEEGVKRFRAMAAGSRALVYENSHGDFQGNGGQAPGTFGENNSGTFYIGMRTDPATKKVSPGIEVSEEEWKRMLNPLAETSREVTVIHDSCFSGAFLSHERQSAENQLNGGVPRGRVIS